MGRCKLMKMVTLSLTADSNPDPLVPSVFHVKAIRKRVSKKTSERKFKEKNIIRDLLSDRSFNSMSA